MLEHPKIVIILQKISKGQNGEEINSVESFGMEGWI